MGRNEKSSDVFARSTNRLRVREQKGSAQNFVFFFFLLLLFLSRGRGCHSPTFRLAALSLARSLWLLPFYWPSSHRPRPSLPRPVFPAPFLPFPLLLPLTPPMRPPECGLPLWHRRAPVRPSSTPSISVNFRSNSDDNLILLFLS